MDRPAARALSAVPRRARVPPPAAETARLIADDKRRGVLLGLLAGEALGGPIDGLSRAEVLRRHGRVVHLLPGAAPGPATTLARELGRALAAGQPLPAPAGRGAAEVAALLLGTALWTQAAGAVSARAAEAAEGGSAPEGSAEDGAAEAAAWLAAALAVALAEDPYRRLRPSALLAAIAGCAVPPGADRAAVLAALAAQSLSPPPPGRAAEPCAALPPALREAALAVHALLVRPGSVEEAVVYAVNLGGRAAWRGALTGALAGAHRGAAGIPERWLAPLPAATALGALAGTLPGARDWASGPAR